nr:MAG TPA: hypothetical protein [Caudoviricetes sp.]
MILYCGKSLFIGKKGGLTEIRYIRLIRNPHKKRTAAHTGK